MKIIGLNIEKYIGEIVTGENCNFETHEEEMKRHILYGEYEGKIISIRLWESEGECYSGWTTANYGHCELSYITKWSKDVENKLLKNIEYVPKTKMIIKDDYMLCDLKLMSIGDSEELDSLSLVANINGNNVEICSMSSDGGDEYYPCGGYHIDMNFFVEKDNYNLGYELSDDTLYFAKDQMDMIDVDNIKCEDDDCEFDYIRDDNIESTIPKRDITKTYIFLGNKDKIDFLSLLNKNLIIQKGDNNEDKIIADIIIINDMIEVKKIIEKIPENIAISFVNFADDFNKNIIEEDYFEL